MTPATSFAGRTTESTDRTVALTGRTVVNHTKPAGRFETVAKRFLSALMRSLAAPHI